jgi:hypothetical protein
MKKAAILAIGTAMILAALSSATESSSAKPSVDAAKFVSKRYGYLIILGGQWKPRYARYGWSGGFPLVDGGEVDAFMESPDRFFLVAATSPPAGTTLREWEKSHAEVMSGFPLCQKARAFRKTKLGGVPAREFLTRCITHDAIVVAAVHRGRAYTFQFVSLKENSATSDRRVFEPGRRSFRFTS